MLIGIDFDNTIVCYDRLFHTLALERCLIPAELQATKTSVRNHLISQGREAVWTELQGLAYGPEISRAELFPGVLEFLREAHRRGIAAVIVSHKTRHAIRGPMHDLHASTWEFLTRNGFFDVGTGLTESQVFLELTKEAKLARIAALGCTHFVDDLPELLDEAAFPANVYKLLFDPLSAAPAAVSRTSVTSWSQLLDLLPSHSAGDLAPDLVALATLLKSAEFPEVGYELTPLPGGRNNRTFLVTTSDRRRSVLKAYFHHPSDARDRLGAEFAFASFCRRFEIDAAPLPLAHDDVARLGLYEHLEGAKVPPGADDRSHVAQAIAFVRKLQAHRNTPEAAAIRPASEACFSLAQHLACIHDRMIRLSEIVSDFEEDDPIARFYYGNLVGVWGAISQRLERAIAIRDTGSLPVSSTADRVLSPSDFGFHNALAQPDGRLRFFDFEYAGWDDPAKLVCDFFCQPDVPVPRGLASWFAAQIAQDLENGEEFLARAELLFPAYRLKWCAIVLNDFLQAGAARRAFSGNAPPSRATLDAQIALARRMLAELQADGDKPIFLNTSPESQQP